MRPDVILIDDGGVMNDNDLRGHQWKELCGQFFAPRLGGDPAAWAEANFAVFDRLFARYLRICLEPDFDYPVWAAADAREWLLGMCQHVGVAPPPDDQLPAMRDQATLWVCQRVRSAIPGAVEAIRRLHAAGYRLMTASGEDVVSLEGYLEGMGVRGCFERLYGPDRIGVAKGSPRFYERLFADAGLAPSQALVVDDSAQAVAWARQVGARALQVGVDLASLADLPRALGVGCRGSGA